jgi:hypothetical protein
MPTWEVRTEHTRQVGGAATTVGAWRAAYSAALEIVLVCVPVQVNLKVDDDKAPELGLSSSEAPVSPVGLTGFEPATP